MPASTFAPGTTGEGPLVPAMAQAELPGGVSVSMTDAVDPPAATSAVTESPIVPTFAKKKKKKKKKIQQPSFSDQYDYTGKVLGDGSYAIVHEIIERRSNTALAVKVITKDMPEHLTQHVRDQVYQEMDLLTEVKGHPNIIEFIAFFETPSDYKMVFEKVDGGELLTHISDRKYFTEREASQVTHDVASALSFVHGKGIAHRDLKPQNVLCVNRDRASPAKLCDFNLGYHAPPSDGTVTPPLYCPVGTPEYMSPEVVDLLQGEQRSYDKRTDVWSLGVILYIMLSGQAPFSGECGYTCGWNEGEHCDRCLELLQDDIVDCNITLSGPEWSGVSGAAKDLIARMLVPEHHRLTADELLRHPWIRQKAPSTPLETPMALRRSSAINFFETFATEANQLTRLDSKEQFLQDSLPVTRRASHATIGNIENSGLLAARRERAETRRQSQMIASSYSTVQAMDLENISTPQFK
jgi:MAP kinase interacting serine/threonine kinase